VFLTRLIFFFWVSKESLSLFLEFRCESGEREKREERCFVFGEENVSVCFCIRLLTPAVLPDPARSVVFFISECTLFPDSSGATTKIVRPGEIKAWD
jgi:hypothetical protein